MVTDTRRYPIIVENLPDVVRVHTLHHERDRGAAILGAHRPEDLNALDTRESGQCGGDQLGLVLLDRRHPDVMQVPGSSTQADDLRGHRGARFKPLWGRRVSGGLHGHRLDHRSAGQERR